MMFDIPNVYPRSDCDCNSCKAGREALVDGEMAIEEKVKEMKNEAEAMREAFRQALADSGHSEATVYDHLALAAYDIAHNAHNNEYVIKIINVTDSSRVLIQRNGVEVHRDIK